MTNQPISSNKFVFNFISASQLENTSGGSSAPNIVISLTIPCFIHNIPCICAHFMTKPMQVKAQMQISNEDNASIKNLVCFNNQAIYLEFEAFTILHWCLHQTYLQSLLALHIIQLLLEIFKLITSRINQHIQVSVIDKWMQVPLNKKEQNSLN